MDGVLIMGAAVPRHSCYSWGTSAEIREGSTWTMQCRYVWVGSFPLSVTVTTMGSRNYTNPLNKAPLRTVAGRGNDPAFGFDMGF